MTRAIDWRMRPPFGDWKDLIFTHRAALLKRRLNPVPLLIEGKKNEQ